MKRFSFPLDRILAWRSLQRDEEQLNLKKVLTERDELLRKERAVRDERSDSEQALAHALHFDAQFVSTLPRWQMRVKAVLIQMASDVVKMETRAVAQRAKLREAERKVQLLERLREQRLGDWKAGIEREQEAFAAETYLAQSSRLKRAKVRG
jgi:hypothetical protein